MRPRDRRAGRKEAAPAALRAAARGCGASGAGAPGGPWRESRIGSGDLPAGPGEAAPSRSSPGAIVLRKPPLQRAGRAGGGRRPRWASRAGELRAEKHRAAPSGSEPAGHGGRCEGGLGGLARPSGAATAAGRQGRGWAAPKSLRLPLAGEGLPAGPPVAPQACDWQLALPAEPPGGSGEAAQGPGKREGCLRWAEEDGCSSLPLAPLSRLPIAPELSPWRGPPGQGLRRDPRRTGGLARLLRAARSPGAAGDCSGCS